MDRIVRTRIYNKSNLIADNITEAVDFSKCEVKTEQAENGVTIETFYYNEE